MNGLTPVTDFSRGPQWFTPPSGVDGLDPETERLMFPLFAVWNRKRARNMLRSAYADGKHRLDHIGFSIPPAMRHIEEVVGWPAKAVAAHAERCMFDGFVSPSANDDPFDLDAVLSANQFGLELPQAIRSSMTHSVAFMTVSPGDPNAGEPPVIVMPYSAQWSAGLWNFRTRSLKAGLVVKDVDDYAMPTMYSIYTPKEVTTLKLAGKWVVDNVWSHNLGRVPMEALPYRPDIDRPFGRSIISRPVMSITDDAVRTVMRTEVSAEFYSAPQLLLLGADKDSFLDDKGNPIPVWEFIIGRINAISRDDNGDVPTVQQISQQSVQPHVEQMRELASRFAGETNVPVSSLGVVTDNPSSAEAMHAAEKDLVIDCAAANRVYGAALRRIAQDIIMIRDRTADITDEMAGITARWRSPALPSVIDSGDAIVKLIGAFPWLADTSVALEEAGFTDEQIARLLAEKRRNQATATATQMLAALTSQQTQKEPENGQQDTTQPAQPDAAAGGQAGDSGDAQTVDDSQ